MCLKIVWSRNSQTELLSVEKQPTETKKRGDEQLCHQDSFVSDYVPVVPRDGITPSIEDSLGKEPPDTVVSDVSQRVAPPPVGVTPSRRIPSDVSHGRERRQMTGTLDLRFKGPYQCREHHGEVLYPSRHQGHHGEVFNR